jgi:hypothetical protein
VKDIKQPFMSARRQWKTYYKLSAENEDEEKQWNRKR